jgi:hypothetical protein
VGHCDWRKLFDEVLNDVKVARGGGIPRPALMAPTPGGTILEAETALCEGPLKATDGSGHTGMGFLVFKASADKGWVEWTYDAPQSGAYILEIRYVVWRGQHPAAIKVNREYIGDVILWNTGGQSTWAWDRKTVTLKKGTNTIRLSPVGDIFIDHLNVLPTGPTGGS